MNKKQQEQEQKALKMLNECNNIMQAYKKGKSNLSELTEAVRTFMTLSMLSSALKDIRIKIGKKLKDNKPLDKLETVHVTMTKLGVCLMTNKGVLSSKIVNDVLNERVII